MEGLRSQSALGFLDQRGVFKVPITSWVLTI